MLQYNRFTSVRNCAYLPHRHAVPIFGGRDFKLAFYRLNKLQQLPSNVTEDMRMKNMIRISELEIVRQGTELPDIPFVRREDLHHCSARLFVVIRVEKARSAVIRKILFRNIVPIRQVYERLNLKVRVDNLI